MEIIKINTIPKLEFGNNYGMRGILFTNRDNESVVVKLPQGPKLDLDKIDMIYPTLEEWKELLFQLDVNDTEGLSEGEKVILRKSQRNVDKKISWKVFRRDEFKCRYCNIDQVPMTVDHIILWEEGGATVEENLLCSCGKCNKTRGSMQYVDWLKSKYCMDKSLKYLSSDEIKANMDIFIKAKTLPRVKVRGR